MTQTPLSNRLDRENRDAIERLSERASYLTPEALWEQAARSGDGTVGPGGVLVVSTGKYTGRSPKDKFIVREPSSEGDIWWGPVNRSIEQETFNRLLTRVLDHLRAEDVYYRDCWIGADPRYRRRLRIFTETAWHNLFAANMFLPMPREQVGLSEPDFTFIHAPGFPAEPDRDGTNSEAFIIIDFGQRIVLIGGTSYAGEIKKSAFTVMNYLLPNEGVLPMHCSANAGPDGDVALFFGLSGTGKTTLSATSDRTLIGDDEHGWTDDTVFNFEGGCYAKVIRLSEEAEPEIYATTRQFGTILENVTIDLDTRALDLDDDSVTENTRGSYPLSSIPNADPTGVADAPKNIFFLTADAFGIIPPISRLTPEQTEYHFLSGYTAKVAGTERGIVEPVATFSPCFGAPFMPLPPRVYAGMLARKLEGSGVNVWLVNTGWTGGPYGIGNRMKIQYTRAMVRAALNGALASVPTEVDPVFGLQVPVSCPGVPPEALRARDTWADPGAYARQAQKLLAMFNDNFRKFG